MNELVAIIFFFVSLTGMTVIIFQKLPLLATLPKIQRGFSLKEIILRLKGKFKNLAPVKFFPYEILLQKLLSKIRILSLKTDSKTFGWLQRLRERSKKNKFAKNDNYWQEIKKSNKK